MLRFKKNIFKDLKSFKSHRLLSTAPTKSEVQELPESAEVVIIGSYMILVDIILSYINYVIKFDLHKSISNHCQNVYY